MDRSREYCSQISAKAGENMVGTAPQVDFWILLELREQWTRDPLVHETNLPKFLKDWLTASLSTIETKGYKPRLQFIRNDFRNSEPLNLFVCSTGCVRRLEFDCYEDLLALDLEKDVNIEVHENHYFVCTHGTRDLCCSRWGLPTMRALSQFDRERTWRSSHLGGHRYAPNVLVLPQGRLYGRVYEQDVGKFFEVVERGGVPWKFLRGRSEFSKEAQACENRIRDHTCSFLEQDSQLVKFASTTGEVEVEIPSRDKEIELLGSCRDDEMTLVRPFNDIL